MRNFKHYLSYVAIFALILTSCSKDEVYNGEPTAETSSISFATILNDFVSDKAALKQTAQELPDCSDALPAYVEVVLTGTASIGTLAAPLVVNVSPTPGDYDGDGEAEYFTEESAALKLEPGPYTLEHFAVYDAADNLIWVAPKTGGSLANFVDNALPMNIQLDAGTKTYVDVEVLCFDNRVVNEYGYLFFDLDTTEAFEFCFFANLCDENGRHFPASYSVDIWIGTDNTGVVLYSDVMNNLSEQGEDPAAQPLCFALPNIDQFEDDQDYLYYEVTAQDWPNVYGDVNQTVISGTLSRNDIEANFNEDETVEYEHLRFGCETEIGEPPTIDEDTSIYIYFDSSGSMNSTLGPLQTMRNTLLKDALISLYNNNETAYNERVNVISRGTERTMEFLNIENETPTGNVISLVFQDEAQSIYTPGNWAVNGPRSGQFDADLSTLRSRLNSFPANYYRGVIFQVATSNSGQFAEFKELIQAVQNGTDSYTGSNGLSDRTEFGYTYDVTPGASPEYYKDLIVAALEDLGYEL